MQQGLNFNMHKAQHYIAHNVFNTSNTIHIPLNAVHASRIESELSNDSVSYFYSSVVSYADAIKGIQSNFYSWAIVKLYYSIFYAFRSILASNKSVIFYIGTKPYSLTCQPGATAKKESGNTHKVVISFFEQKFPSHILLSQDINLMSPCNWFIEKREEANYKLAKFTEPTIPQCLENTAKYSLRSLLGFYIDDKTHIHTFDKDHAMLAFPLKLIQFAQKDLSSLNQFYLLDEDVNFLKNLVKDSQGPIPGFFSIF